MEDFRNMTISLPFPTSRRSLKKFIGMLKPVVCFGDSFLHAKHVSTSSRWEPVLPLGRPLFLPYMMVTSWHPCLVEASRISWPEMISTTTIISPPTLLCSPTNGDNHLPLHKFWTFLVSQTLLHRAMSNDERAYPEPHIFKPERFLKNGELDSSVRDPMDIAFGFGRRWAFFFSFH